jgi:capsular exopolysaccharide synthesis family protein
VAPTSPGSPRPKLNAALALLISGILGSAVLYAYALLSDHYRSPEEAAADLDMPILAEIPRANRGDEVSIEAFRQLRTSVMLALQNLNPHEKAGGAPKPGLELLVSAAERGAGKTFVTTNLARSLASAGWRTIVVDGDLRRPTVHSEFGLPLRPGLTDALDSGSMDMGTIAQHVPMHSAGSKRPAVLQAVVAGTPITDPSERLSSPEMADAVDALAYDNEVLVFDSAPLEAVVDAVVLSRYALGVLFVVDMRRSRRRVARRAVALLRASNALLLGIVINRHSSGAKYNYYGRFVPEEIDSAASAG